MKQNETDRERDGWIDLASSDNDEEKKKKMKRTYAADESCKRIIDYG